VHVPTLVLHCVDDGLVPVSLGRDVARRIEGAVFQELKGPDHFVWIHNSAAVPDAIEQFVTGRAPRPRDDDRILTTVVFTDIVNSTRRLSGAGDAGWRAVLAEHDRRMDDLLERLGGQSVKHTGDGRLAHFARPARAVRFAAAMTQQAEQCGLQIRAGLHTGECDAVGKDLRGLAVNLAARVMGLAGPGEVLVSSTVKDLVVGSGLSFTAAGAHELKGAPGAWRLYRYDGDLPGPLPGYETDVRHMPEPVGRD
jgi:class 3 adenylate cyclase